MSHANQGVAQAKVGRIEKRNGRINFSFLGYVDSGLTFWPNVDDSASKEHIHCLMSEQPMPYTAEELYDLAMDPMEMRNVFDSDEMKGVLSDMRERLQRWMVATEDTILQGMIPLPPGARVNPSTEYSPQSPTVTNIE